MNDFNPEEALAETRHEFGEHGGVNMSVESSTTFTVMDPGTMPEIFQGQRGPDDGGCYLYGRHFNPTVYALGRELAAIEGTEAAYLASSGMGAVVSAIMQCCNTGDHIVAANTLYGGTFALLSEYLPAKCNIHTTFVDATDVAAVKDAITDQTRVVYAESLSNPTLQVADIPALAEVAHAASCQLIIDNTFCPLIMSPAKLGADCVVHSLTKFINGSSDIIAGAICGTRDFVTSLMDVHMGSLMLLGPTLDPTQAFSLSMRIPHLGLRMKEHSHRALVFSQRLEELGLDVVYPGLKEHPQHELFKTLANPDYGFGGLFTLDVGDPSRAEVLMDVLQNRDRFGYMAVSLGYHHTLMSCSASSTASELTEEELEVAGIKPGLIRFSIGYTGGLEQRWKQFIDALKSVGITTANQG